MNSYISKIRSALHDAKLAFTELINECPGIVVIFPGSDPLINMLPADIADSIQDQYDAWCRRKAALSKLTEEDIKALGLWTPVN